MSSFGTAPANAALAAALRSRESPSTPTSFCIWIIRQVRFRPSTSLRCRMKAA